MSQAIKKFVRKQSMPGVYGIRFNNRHIEIKDRDVFSTRDDDLIKVFKGDPEIIEYVPESKSKGPEVYSDMSMDKLTDLCAERSLPKPDRIETAIELLKEWDKENSKEENDQGEQAPE